MPRTFFGSQGREHQRIYYRQQPWWRSSLPTKKETSPAGTAAEETSPMGGIKPPPETSNRIEPNLGGGWRNHPLLINQATGRDKLRTRGVNLRGPLWR